MNIDQALKIVRATQSVSDALELHKQRLIDCGVVFDAVALYDLDEAVSELVGAVDEA